MKTTKRGQAPEGGSLRRRVLPGIKTPEHSILGKHLDVIYNKTDDAIYGGLCKGDVKRLDISLAKIIRAAESARAMLRQNHKDQPPEARP